MSFEICLKLAIENQRSHNRCSSGVVIVDFVQMGEKLFKNRLRKICGRPPLKKFTGSIFQYFVHKI